MWLNLKILLKLTSLCLLFGATLYAQPGSKSSNACSMTQNGVTLNWNKMSNVAALKTSQTNRGKVKLPKRYTVYTVDAGRLRTILTAIKSKGKEQSPMVLPLSDEPGCAGFHYRCFGNNVARIGSQIPGTGLTERAGG